MRLLHLMEYVLQEKKNGTGTLHIHLACSGWEILRSNMYRNPILDTDGSEHPVQQVGRFSHEFATSKVGIY